MSLSSPAPTRHLFDTQPISETHGPHPLRVALPQTSDPALPEFEPLVPNSRRGQMFPTHPTPVPGSDTATMPPPIVDSPPIRGLFDGPLLSRGAVRLRLVWAKRRENNRRRISTAKKTNHAHGSPADTSPSFTPNHRTDLGLYPLPPGWSPYLRLESRSKL